MTPEEFFGRFSHSAWRLETLPRYDTDDPGLIHFEATGEVLPLDWRLAKLAWMAQVREAIAAGKRLGRVHVLSRPLTPYLEYELATYGENVVAGEDVRIAETHGPDDRVWLRGLRDFWLLDGETDEPFALLLDYDGDGRSTGITVTGAPEVIRRCRWDQQMAMACSVPLADYLATA